MSGDLFGGLLYPPEAKLRKDPHATEVEAAQRALGTSAAKRVALWRWLLDRGDRGATDEETADGLGWGLNTVRPRRLECRERGYVMDSGEHRKTASGSRAIVWVAIVPVRFRDGEITARAVARRERLLKAAGPEHVLEDRVRKIIDASHHNEWWSPDKMGKMTNSTPGACLVALKTLEAERVCKARWAQGRLEYRRRVK